MCMPKAPKMPEAPPPPPEVQDSKAADVNASRRKKSTTASGTLITGPSGATPTNVGGGGTLLGG